MSVSIDLSPRPVQPTQRHVQPARTRSEEAGEEGDGHAEEKSPPRRSWQQGRAPRKPSPDEDDDGQADCVDAFRLWLQRWTLIFIRYPLTERVAHFAYIRSLYLQALLCLIVMLVRAETAETSTAPRCVRTRRFAASADLVTRLCPARPSQFCQLLDSDILTYDTPVPNPLRGILIFVSVSQVALLLLAHVGLNKELGGNMRIVRPWSVWNMYLSLICVFTTLNFTCFAMSRFCFSGQNSARNNGWRCDHVPRASLTIAPISSVFVSPRLHSSR